jgi:uncharacterized protein (DUF934 family)
MHFIDPGSSLPEDTLVLDSTQDVTRMKADLAGRSSVALQFSKWTDGRAYSQAVLLRARLGYAGKLIATGEVLADMLPLLRRCGFDAVQLRADQSVEAAQRALGFFDNHYQRSTPARAAAFSAAMPPVGA